MQAGTLGARVIALAVLVTLGGCAGGVVCPEGTELVGDACLASDGGAPPGLDAGPGMDATTPEEDAGPDAGRDGGVPPPLPDAGPVTCTDPVSYYRDFDLDGFGDPSASVESCDPVEGFVTEAGDCNDTCDACNPDATEVCNSVDDDCDGSTDEAATSTFYLDGDGDGHGNPARTIEGCAPTAGYVAAGDDCDDTCAACFPGASETCDSRDNDCNGSVDDGAVQTFYLDADGDGRGNPARSATGCTAPAGHVDNADDCDDTCAVCFAGATESCDGRDNDCDGTADEGVTTRYYRDADGDGHGLASSSVNACSAPSGHVASSDDCNDGCATCYPGRAEACDGQDNDCNWAVDNGVLSTFYRDADGDGHGLSSMSTMACTAPSGHVASSDDCNDGCATCYPGRAEACDGQDNDCNGTVDNGVLSTFYRDQDADTYGTSASMQACTAPSGYASRTGDCDDANAQRNPGRTEVCNAIDDDCDGSRDETFSCVQGTAVNCSTACGSVGSGLCSDTCTMPTLASCNPPSESCNGDDDDCDGVIDDYQIVAGTPITATAAGDMHRPKVVRDGSYLYSFWTWGANVYAWRHNLDGTIAGLMQVPMVAGSENFDVAARNGRIVYAYRPDGGTGVSVRYLDPATLSITATQTIAAIAPDQIEIELSSTGGFSLYTRESGSIVGRLGTSTSVGAAATISPSDGAFDLFSRDGTNLYLAYVANGTLTVRTNASGTWQLTNIWSAAAGETFADPSIAVGSSGHVLIALSVRAASAANSYIAGIVRNSLAGVSATQRLSQFGVATATADGPLLPMTDVDFADDYFTVTAIERPAATSSNVGTPRAYRVRALAAASGGFSIDPQVGSTVQEGFPIVRQSGRSDLVFYNPTGSQIAARPLGCF